MTWLLIALGVLLLFAVAQVLHLATVLSWEDRQTVGLAYYGLPAEGRERFRRQLRRHARLLFPILRFLGRRSSFTFEKASFHVAGIAGPRGTCSPDSFEAALRYQPRPEDVFVVTQMKCGTTWMQHVVYEVLHRGAGDLVEAGATLYSRSAWLEARKSVPVDQAPLIGEERPSRLIKTHLPARVCPWSEQARYIYVARHPVACFASCVDFIGTNVGALAPALADVERWFCADETMWWGGWPRHVDGWWQRARENGNVLFCHFEEMKKDLPGVVRRVTDFLALEPLTDAEVVRIVEKCSFEYMQLHKDAFEMHPPHILATDAELFVRGTADRHRDVPAEVRRRVAGWCADAMADAQYPLAERYPDVIAPLPAAPR